VPRGRVGGSPCGQGLGRDAPASLAQGRPSLQGTLSVPTRGSGVIFGWSCWYNILLYPAPADPARGVVASVPLFVGMMYPSIYPMIYLSLSVHRETDRISSAGLLGLSIYLSIYPSRCLAWSETAAADSLGRRVRWRCAAPVGPHETLWLCVDRCTCRCTCRCTRETLWLCVGRYISIHPSIYPSIYLGHLASGAARTAAVSQPGGLQAGARLPAICPYAGAARR